MSQKPSATEGRPHAPDHVVSVPRTGRPRALPFNVYLPGFILLGLCWAAWLWHLGVNEGDMREWGVSAAALAQGRWDTIYLHMFAHAGLFHILMNSLVLAAFGGPVVWAMGGRLGGALRFFLFYGLSGLCGAALYVGLNPDGNIPAVGASGAISGMIGFVARLGSRGQILSLTSRDMWGRVWDFIKANLILIGIFAIPFFLGGSGIMIAWEGHLGGFLFGLFAAGLFVGKPRG